MTTFMTLLIILFFVFAAVALMVILGERFGKPMEVEQQQKYSKILWIVVFIAIIAAIIRQLL
ncbi:MAG: Na+-driven multidrug efflux pump [Colwellia sp.]|jgi:Na+-driven multidrug efflux pump